MRHDSTPSIRVRQRPARLRTLGPDSDFIGWTVRSTILTIGAIEGCPALVDGPADDASAAASRAGLAGPVVDPQIVVVPALSTVGSDEIAEGGATLVQIAGPPAAQPEGPGRRMKAGLPQCLRGIDVADPGDHALIEQEGLERPAAGARVSMEGSAGDPLLE